MYKKKKRSKKVTESIIRKETISIDENDYSNESSIESETEAEERYSYSRASRYRRKLEISESLTKLGDSTIRAREVSKCLSPHSKEELKRLLCPEFKPRSTSERLGRPKKLNLDQETLVRSFWETDKISRILPGKKRQERKNIVKNENGKEVKVNVPKRYLYYTQAETFLKFKDLNPEINISRSTFYRLKPPQVCKTPPSSRLTCGCVKCINFKFLIQELGMKVSHFLQLHTCPLCDLQQCQECKSKLKIAFECEDEIIGEPMNQLLRHYIHGYKLRQ